MLAPASHVKSQSVISVTIAEMFYNVTSIFMFFTVALLSLDSLKNG